LCSYLIDIPAKLVEACNIGTWKRPYDQIQAFVERNKTSSRKLTDPTPQLIPLDNSMAIFPNNYSHSTIRQERYSHPNIQVLSSEPFPFLFYSLQLAFPSEPMLPGIGLLLRRRRTCSGAGQLAAYALSCGDDSALHVPIELTFAPESRVSGPDVCCEDDMLAYPWYYPKIRFNLQMENSL